MLPEPLVGPYGGGALDRAASLVEHGVNAVWFHGFDAKAFDACDQHSLAACVEFPTFRADFRRYPELIPTGADGKPIRYGSLVQGICLSQAWFLDQIEERLVAGVEKYEPAGIWLDYLTYAGWFETPEPDLQESCFCPDCVETFRAASGLDVSGPAEILSRHARAWRNHKCLRIARLGAKYSAIIRSHRRHCLVGIYMCPWTPDEFDGALSRIFAQDYRLLAPLVDVFTPLIYAQKSGRPATWAGEFMDGSRDFVPRRRLLQPILDVLDFPASMTCLTEAATPSWGVQLFAGAEVFADGTKAEQFARLAEALRQRWSSRDGNSQA